jgi:hypothetical protein
MESVLKALLVVTLARLGTGCSSDAQDAHSDLDCAVITGLFYKGAEQQGSPAMQQAALGLAAKWYSAEINHTGQVNSPEFTDEYVENIRDSLNADPKVASGKLDACLNRARSNPRFEPFVRAAGWKGRI